MSRHMLPLWAAPVFGVVAGTLTRLTDLLPQDMWGIASVATLFGFWVVSVVFLVRYSHSCLNAGWNVSSYLLMMSVAFYVGEYLLGQFLPTFDNGDFRWCLLLIYGVASLICGAAAMVLYLWKKDKWYQPILLAGRWVFCLQKPLVCFFGICLREPICSSSYLMLYLQYGWV